MKILIINPPKIHKDYFTLRDEICFQDVRYRPFPIRLAQLIPIIKESHSIEVLDANIMSYSWDDVEDWLKKYQEEKIMAVIFKSAAGLISHDLKLAEIVKRLYGNKAASILIETVVAPIYPERMLNDFPDLDYIIRGQPEVVIPELLNNIDNPKNIKGLAFRDNNKVILTEEAATCKNLDELPFMSYQYFDMNKYNVPILIAPFYEKVFKGVRMRTTRDCPYGCPFCIIGSSKWRGYDRRWSSMSPGRVVDELEFLVKEYGIEAVFFWDETFTLDQNRAEEICRMIIERNIKIIWRCLTRIDCVNQSLLEKMFQAGCRMIEYGLESGSKDVRQELHKRFSNQEVIEVIAQTKKAGINVNCDFIVGLPWETKETLQETLGLAKSILSDNVHLTMAFPYPDTEFYRIAVEEKLLEIEDIYQLMLTERVRVGANPITRSRKLSRTELKEGWQNIRSEIDRYYLTQNVFKKPWRIFSYLSSTGSPMEAMRLLAKGMKLSVRKLKGRNQQ